MIMIVGGKGIKGRKHWPCMVLRTVKDCMHLGAHLLAGGRRSTGATASGLATHRISLCRRRLFLQHTAFQRTRSPRPGRLHRRSSHAVGVSFAATSACFRGRMAGKRAWPTTSFHIPCFRSARNSLRR